MVHASKQLPERQWNLIVLADTNLARARVTSGRYQISK